MSDDPLKYSSDLKALIGAARKQGKTTQEIVVILCRGSTYADVRAMAEKWSPELGISPTEFVRMAGRRS